jgi:hypothetical protein
MIIVGSSRINIDTDETPQYGPPLYWSSLDNNAQTLQFDLTTYPFGGDALSINNNGNIVGNGYIQRAIEEIDYILSVPLYWPSINDPPRLLTYDAVTYIKGVTTTGINKNGNIVGYGQGEDYINVPLYWPSINDPPQLLTYDAATYIYGVLAVRINNNGNIIGFGSNSIGKSVPLYWPSFNESPQILKYDSTTYQKNGVVISGINDNGHIVGYAPLADTILNIDPLYWPSVDDLPQVLKYDATTYSILVISSGINNKGNIVGGGLNSIGKSFPLYWSSVDNLPQALKYDANTYPRGVTASGINDQILVPPVISKVCFPADAPMKTDDGIEQLQKEKDSINKESNITVRLNMSVQFKISLEKHNL